MGCDIHPHYEVKKDGKWEMVNENLKRDWDHPAYINRGYGLFAVLAGVRNSHGLIPISKPRGLPDDVSRYVASESTYSYDKEAEEDPGYEGEIRESMHRWVRDGSSKLISEKPFIVSDPDMHSHSWVTLRELQEFDWSRTLSLTGWISEVTYRGWTDKTSCPDGMICGGIGGGSIFNLSEEEMVLRIEQDVSDDKVAWCRVSWFETYEEFCRNHNPLMKYMSTLGGPDDVRLVFWFDN